MHRRVRHSAAAVGVWVGLGVSWPAGVAQAQQVQVFSTMTARSGVAGPGAAINARGLDRYAQTLGLSVEQKEAAAALLEGYIEETRAAAKEVQSAMEAAFSEFQDSEDHESLGKATGAAQARHAERTESLEKGFFSDIRQLLTPDQEEAWPKLERLRRREKGLAHGSVSGEAVDLTEVLAEVRLEASARAALAEALEQYEADIDRAIQARDSAIAAAQPPDSAPGNFDFAAFQAALAAAKEAGGRVREVNQTHQRRLEGLLPEEHRGAFADAFRRRCFPGVYRRSTASRAIESASKLGDLTPEQAAALEELRAGYERELAPANQAWAQAIVGAESEGQDGTISMGGSMGGSVMRIRMGEESGPVAEARKARKAVDERAREKLESILTADQRERLPADEEPEEVAVPAVGQRMFIRSGG